MPQGPLPLTTALKDAWHDGEDDEDDEDDTDM
jgi:hypothetical protein